jgi:succinyl-diaminopimelate desuccinylase
MAANLNNMDDRDFIIELAQRIIPVQAISPESGGEGESKRADLLLKLLSELGFNGAHRYDITDNHGVQRSSIILKEGNCERTLWIIAHIDTVPVGNRSLWTYEPFQPTVKGDRIYGRGTSDNGQAVFLSMLLLKKLKKSDLKFNLGIALVADEEVGSKYGIQFLLEKNLFSKNDLILVPDAGTSQGTEIEIAEKSILWIKFKVSGKQYHASQPFLAVNSNREGMKFFLKLDQALHEKFSLENSIFSPPYSTFEPTKREKNVDNVNTIPGTEIQYYDCRVLPKYDLDVVMDLVDNTIREFQKTSKAKITYEIFQKEQAPLATPETSEIVVKLKAAIKAVKGKDANVVGIGGGTCAAYFRKKGYPAAVWCTTEPEVAHQADEYVLIPQILGDREIIEKIIY